MKTETTIIELTPFEAALFIRFQKHRALIELLESINAFDVKNGTITIHFSRLGEIIGVDKQETFSPHVITEVIHTKEGLLA